MIMKTKEKIYIAGHVGLLGSAVLRLLKSKGFNNLIVKTHRQCDLLSQRSVESLFKKERPDYVFLCAARVGGIQANISYPAELMYENSTIQNNVIHQSYVQGVKKLIFFGSSCIYPKESPGAIKEEDLLSGPVEPTNEAYAMAKISGIKLCQAYDAQFQTNFITAVLANMYGPYDHFDIRDSHVIPALIMKLHKAKKENMRSCEVWGSGRPVREFLYADDAADAAFFLMQNYDQPDIINVGTGHGVSVKELAFLIKDTVGFKGEIVFDATKPDGIKKKILNVSKINGLGWRARVHLKDGIRRTVGWFLKYQKAL
jgi:GDP-L-fucose synthase